MGNRPGRSKASSLASSTARTQQHHRAASATYTEANPWLDANFASHPQTYPPAQAQLPADFDPRTQFPQNNKTVKKPKKAFQKWEREMLKTTFNDLAVRSASGKSIDKETFLKFFRNVPGMLGERLFYVFNRSGSGTLDFDEFLSGLATYSRGTMEHKVAFLFRMCNLSNNGRISRAELETMCNNLVFLNPDAVMTCYDDALDAQRWQIDREARGLAGIGGGIGAERDYTRATRWSTPEVYRPQEAAEIARQNTAAGGGAYRPTPLRVESMKVDVRSESPAAVPTAEEGKMSEANSPIAASSTSMTVPPKLGLPLTTNPSSSSSSAAAASSAFVAVGSAPPSSALSSFPAPYLSPLSSPHHHARHSSMDALSPSHVEPDWLHASRVKEMVDDAFEMEKNSSNQSMQQHPMLAVVTGMNNLQLNGTASGPSSANSPMTPQPLTTRPTSASVASPPPPHTSAAAAPTSPKQLPSSSTSPAASAVALTAPSTPSTKPDKDSEPTLSMYAFGRWLQHHPGIFDLLDAAFVGLGGGAGLGGSGNGNGNGGPNGDGNFADIRSNMAQSGTITNLPTVQRNSIVGMGPGGTPHRNSATDLSDAGAADSKTNGGNHRANFSVPALLTPQHTASNLLAGSSKPVSIGNSPYRGPLHNGGAGGAGGHLTGPSMSVGATAFPSEYGSINGVGGSMMNGGGGGVGGSTKDDEKATWKNGPRLSITGGPVQNSGGGGRMSVDGGHARFQSHASSPAASGGVPHHPQHQPQQPHVMSHHQSTASLLVSGSPTLLTSASYTNSMGGSSASSGVASHHHHHPPSSHPFYFHCDHCGFDLILKYCMGCGNQLTCFPVQQSNSSAGNVASGGGGMSNGQGAQGGAHTTLHSAPASSASSTASIIPSSSFSSSSSSSTNPINIPTSSIPYEYSCSHCAFHPFAHSTPRYCLSCGYDLNTLSRNQKTYMKTEPPLLPSLTWQRQQRGTSIEGYLKKVGARLKNIISRWYVIRDNFMYTYTTPNDIKPSHVLFLEGCFVESVNHEDRSSKLKYGIEIILSEGEHSRKSRFIYASSNETRQQWLDSIRLHANVHDIDEFYSIGTELGVGRFSSVREGISKTSGKKYAIKIIDKSEVNDKEREALRTEVAVLKLIHHPSIIRLKNVFETRKQMFLVLSFVRGGDLFDRLVKKKRFNEYTTQQLMIQLLQAVQYLHVRGIVHRDLKPENIMMVKENDDTQIMLCDFGLGAFALPDGAMKLPCGTLTFTAPEVLIGKGYGMEVDLWSIGVVCYMLIRGTLPFDGDSPAAIKEKLLAGRYSFEHPIWNDVSMECKELIKGLLNVDPSTRLTCQQALEHPFFKLKFTTPQSNAAAQAAAAASSATSSSSSQPSSQHGTLTAQALTQALKENAALASLNAGTSNSAGATTTTSSETSPTNARRVVVGPSGLGAPATPVAGVTASSASASPDSPPRASSQSSANLNATFTTTPAAATTPSVTPTPYQHIIPGAGASPTTSYLGTGPTVLAAPKPVNAQNTNSTAKENKPEIEPSISPTPSSIYATSPLPGHLLLGDSSAFNSLSSNLTSGLPTGSVPGSNASTMNEGMVQALVAGQQQQQQQAANNINRTAPTLLLDSSASSSSASASAAASSSDSVIPPSHQQRPDRPKRPSAYTLPSLFSSSLTHTNKQQAAASSASTLATEGQAQQNDATKVDDSVEKEKNLVASLPPAAAAASVIPPSLQPDDTSNPSVPSLRPGTVMQYSAAAPTPPLLHGESDRVVLLSSQGASSSDSANSPTFISPTPQLTSRGALHSPRSGHSTANARDSDDEEEHQKQHAMFRKKEKIMIEE